ncbi:hypothetical protein Droror1_Dr00023162 [Drosera rotundifolia]
MASTPATPTTPKIEINGLRFTYPGIDGHPPPGSIPLIQDFSLTLNAGNRCLLVGSNGAGKTTILKILGGKHLVEPSMVRVMGRSAFHDTGLTTSGDLAYLGGEVSFRFVSFLELYDRCLDSI